MLLPAIPLVQAIAQHNVVKQYATLGTVVLTHCETLPSPDAALLHNNATFLGPVSLDHLELVGQWLDKGAIVAIFTLPPGVPIENALEALSILPRSRVGVLIDYSQGLPAGGGEALAEAVSVFRTTASHVLVRLPADWGAEGLPLKDHAHALVAPSATVRGRAGSEEFVQLILECPRGGWSGEDVNSLHKVEVDILGAVAQDGEPHPPEVLLPLLGSGVDALDAFIACLRTDRPDGLFTTVVVDELGVALGLVYSSRDSIRASVACGRGVYYSRSKGGLWRKGDTSGAWQELVGMAFDCDVDALRITVRQKGEPPVFCHLNRRNCWRGDKGLGALQRTLQSRKQSAPPGSYTARLFSDPELLRNKLVEEAQELSEAEEPDHVAAEAADLLFFALTRCVAAGVTLEEVEAHLDVRSLKLTRRPGNAKEHRIQAAQHILDNK